MHHLELATADDEQLKTYVASELERVRARSFGLTTDILGEEDLIRQHSALMSPLVWDLAHVSNYEELWLLRETMGSEPMRPEIDPLYDAFEHPRSQRPSLPLLSAAESTGYAGLVRRKVLDSLETVRLDPSTPLLAEGFVYGMVLQHEHQHDETMLATHQLRRGPAVLPADDDVPAPRSRDVRSEVLVPAGEFVMGTSTDPWAYDNERPAHRVRLPPYWIDITPVTVGAYRGFVEAGGYDDPRLWSEHGWQWRLPLGTAHARVLGAGRPVVAAAAVRPRRAAAGRRTGAARVLVRGGRVRPVGRTPPAQRGRVGEGGRMGSRRPAAAGASPGATNRRPASEPTSDSTGTGPHRRFLPGRRFGGRRAQLLGDVWEWTSSDFTGHPGFCTFPYAEYSEVFFGSDYKVLRGGSWASDPLAPGTPSVTGTTRSADRSSPASAPPGTPDVPASGMARGSPSARRSRPRPAALAAPPVLCAPLPAARRRQRGRVRGRLVRRGARAAGALPAFATDLE